MPEAYGKLEKGAKIMTTDLTQPENANEFRVDRSRLGEWADFYPTLSAWFRDLECPDLLEIWEKTDKSQGETRARLARWRELGRPEVRWQEAGLG